MQNRKNKLEQKTKRKDVQLVTVRTNIAKLVYEYPEAAEVLMSFGLHCIGCFASGFDTIKQGASIHGMSDEEINEMIDEINKVISSSNDEGQ